MRTEVHALLSVGWALGIVLVVAVDLLTAPDGVVYAPYVYFLLLLAVWQVGQASDARSDRIPVAYKSARARAVLSVVLAIVAAGLLSVSRPALRVALLVVAAVKVGGTVWAQRTGRVDGAAAVFYGR